MKQHVVSEGSDGGREVRRRARIGVEVAEAGGDKQDERNVQVVCQNSAARVQRLQYQQLVRRSLQSRYITNYVHPFVNLLYKHLYNRGPIHSRS